MSALPAEIDFELDADASTARMNRAMGYLLGRIRAVDSLAPEVRSAVENLRKFAFERVTEVLVPIFGEAQRIEGELQTILDAWTVGGLADLVAADVLAQTYSKVDADGRFAALANLAEAIDDRVAALIQNGSNLTKTYDDAGNLLSLAVAGLLAANIGDFSEAVDDRVAALIQGSGIVKTYDDAGNLLTLTAATGLKAVSKTGDFAVAAADDGTLFDFTGAAGPIAAALPAANTVPANFTTGFTGRSYKENSIRYLTATRSGTDTIDGEAANLNVYAETVIFRRNAAATGWIVQKRKEVLCWDYTTTAAAAAVDFTAPFNDAQFASYRIEYSVLNNINSQNLQIKLGIAGAIITAANYTFQRFGHFNGTVDAANGSGAAAIFLLITMVGVDKVVGIVHLNNARATSGGQNGPRVLGRAYGASAITLGGGHVSNSGALSGVRFDGGGGGNLEAGSNFRIFGIRKGN